MNDIVNAEVAVEAVPVVEAPAIAPEVTEEGFVQVGEGPVATEILPL